MARVMQEDEALPAGRHPFLLLLLLLLIFTASSLTLFTFCPFCSPNLTSFSVSFMLSFTPLTLALCHLPPYPSSIAPSAPFHFPFHSLLESFSRRLSLSCNCRNTAAAAAARLNGFFHLKKKKLLLRPTDPIPAMT